LYHEVHEEHKEVKTKRRV